MLTTNLLEKLLEIERSIGRMDNTALRSMLMDAQVQLLHLEKDVIGVLEEVRGLRERQEPVVAVPAALARLEARGGEERRREERWGEERRAPAVARKPAFAL